MSLEGASVFRTLTSAQIPKPSECELHLAADISWVDEPDRLVLNSLAALGFHYRCINTFIEVEQREEAKNVRIAASAFGGAPSPRQYENRNGSAYSRALAAGLREILDVYEAAVLDVQQQVVVAAPCPPTLSSLNYFLSDFKLHELVHGVHGKGTSSAQLWSLLNSRAHCGIPLVESVMQRLLWHCNNVLYKQISSWMVHGVHLDPFGPTSIHTCTTTPATICTLPYLSLLFPLDGAWGAARPLWTDDHDHLHHTCSTTLATICSLPFLSLLSPSLQDGWCMECCLTPLIDDRALPPCISYDVAEVVVFVGKAVRVLKQPAGSFKGKELLPYK
eukprot:gene175-1699_t